MRLPWVSRAHYELLQHNYGEARHLRDSMCELYKGERARFDALLTKYHALKLQGAVIADSILPTERKEIDPVTQRINILSAGKPGLRAQMMKQVQSDRLLDGLGDIEILQRIEAGVTTDEGVMA